MSSTVPSLAQKCMQQKIGKVFTIILTLTIFGWAVAGSRAAQATEYYVSPNGSNSNDGTFDHPWKTVEYALGQLSPGDVLYLRAGIYYEHEIRTI